MNSLYIASSILRGKWLLEPSFAESQGAIVANFINKYTEFEHNKPDELTAFAVGIEAKNIAAARHSWYSGFDKAPEGSIAVIRIFGALMKNDQSCGPIGTESIGEIIKAADNHHNIDAIVLHIDSPGGSVDGTEALANVVKNTKKPIISFVDGLMASAALWIGSSADEVMASTDTDEIGSVGVISTFSDIQPYWEKLGIKFHSITASTSPDKVKMWEDVRAGRYDQYRKEVLDPIDQKFMDVIRQNRPSVKDEHLTGKIFFARDVMGVFVDSLGVLDDAIIRASELAQQSNAGSNGSQASINNQNKSNMSKKYLKIQKAIGSQDALEVEADGSRTFSPDEMSAVEAALAANAGEELQGQLDTANKDLKAANATISERDQTIEQLQAEVAELKKDPAEPGAKVTNPVDDPEDDKDGPVVKEKDSMVSGIEKVSQAYLGKGLND